MRGILFRGKRKDNGEWVEGGYYREDYTDNVYITFWNSFGLGFMDSCQVDPETVGQYTGLYDKYDKRIFEGDMLKPFDDEIDKMVVVFNQGQFLLCLYGDRGYRSESGDWEYDGSNYGVIECEPLSSYGEEIQVIGNIHDNSELTEEKHNE